MASYLKETRYSQNAVTVSFILTLQNYCMAGWMPFVMPTGTTSL